MPLVTVGLPARSRALPMATTSSPTWILSESPSVTVGRLLASRILTSATSGPRLALPTPTTSAVRLLVSLNSVTFTVDARPTTWALVSTSPSGEMIMPEPAPLLVVTVTTAGSTLASTSRTWLPLATGGAELDDADVLAGTVVGRTTVVLLPRVAAMTPPLTLAPMRAATAATIHSGAARFGRGSAVDGWNGGGGGGGAGGAGSAGGGSATTGSSPTTVGPGAVGSSTHGHAGAASLKICVSLMGNHYPGPRFR